MNESFIQTTGGDPVPRTETGQAELRESQRERLMAAARDVFARKGWAATMADIAAEAGVSQGLAYRYFAGKGEIVQALMEQAMAKAPLPSAQGLSGTPWERLEELTRQILQARRERAGFYRILLHALDDPAAPAEIRERVRGQGRRFRDMLLEVIAEGQAAGEVALGDPQELALALLAVFSGLSSPALGGAQGALGRVPSAEVVLRMLRPGRGQEEKA